MLPNIRQGFRLGPWKIEPLRGAITDANGDSQHLEPKVMDVFVCLAEHANELVTREELQETVWNGQVATDELLTGAVSDLRRVLLDDRGNPKYIETVPKRGYRLISAVTPLTADSEILEIALHSPNGRPQRRRNLAIFAGIASIAVAIVLTVKPELRGRLLPTDDDPRNRSVAVLPFVDMSEDGNQQYLADGVAEELIHVLSNLPDLRVTARTSSFAFRDRQEDIRQIGSKLNVATILQGSIRIDGDRIRVTSQLADTRDGYHLWSHTFDRHTSDLFRIQNEIAVAVARTLEYRELDVLATDDLAARPDELQAYDFYLLGLHQLRKPTLSSTVLAIQHFERAIEIDPSFARAYAGLSESYTTRSGRLGGDQELLDKAETAAEYALLLDDQSGKAFAALGLVKGLTGDHSGAEVAYRKAVALNPNDVRAQIWLARVIRWRGKEDEAFAMVEKALELHPMSGELNYWMGNYYDRHSDWDMAFKYYKRAMDREADFFWPYAALARHYQLTGQLDQAIPYFRKVVDLTTDPPNPGLFIARLASTYVDIGDFESATQVIRRMREIDPNYFGATNSEIQLQLARGDFSAARDIVHGLLPTYIDKDRKDWETSQMAFYEMVIGDTDHAEEIYTRFEAAPESCAKFDAVDLCNGNQLEWGMLGAVNLAYLHKSNGDTRAAQELLDNAREYIESRSDPSWFVSSKLYVLAQIAAVEGNNNVAIEYFRKAVDAGWARPWFGRIDPIMADLRKNARYMQILEKLEDKLLEMREHPKRLASNEP